MFLTFNHHRKWRGERPEKIQADERLKSNPIEGTRYGIMLDIIALPGR